MAKYANETCCYIAKYANNSAEHVAKYANSPAVTWQNMLINLL